MESAAPPKKFNGLRNVYVLGHVIPNEIPNTGEMKRVGTKFPS
jgi:hypothetical protein